MPDQCTRAEWMILEMLWKREAMTEAQLLRELQPETGWTKQAVHTLLKRLQQKEIIQLEERDSVERYVCKLSKEQVHIAPWALEESLFQKLKDRLAIGGTRQ